MLKILPASKAKNPAILSRFEREARLLTVIDHPNVIRAFQLGESSGINFIVMEYVDGETLEDVLGRRKRLPASFAPTLPRPMKPILLLFMRRNSEIRGKDALDTGDDR